MPPQSHNHRNFSVLSTPARCDDSGNPCHLHTDWQGSVTMVTDKKGKILQHNGYYPYGEPWREPSGQPNLFSSKERLRQHTLTEYDFTARRYNSALLLWTTPDPLADSYTPNHPLIYCASNPLKYTDPTGMEIVVNGSEPEIKKMEVVLNYFRGNELYNTVMRTIDESDETFTIIFKIIPPNPDNKKSVSFFNPKNRIMTVDKGDFSDFITEYPSQIYNAVAEELYHIYQEITPNEKSLSNFEFEAKVAAIISYPGVAGSAYADGIKDFNNDYIYKLTDDLDNFSLSLLRYNDFTERYLNYGKKFQKYYINMDSKLPGYTQPVNEVPIRLLNLIFKKQQIIQ